MADPQKEATAQFSRPWVQVFQILTVLALTGFGAYVALPRVMSVFLSNLYLNGFIVFVFVMGVFACLFQIFQVFTSVGWLERFTLGNGDAGKAPQLLAPLATLLGSRSARTQISSSSSGSILDSVGTRIDEVRDITRYIVNLLIFLGLLGTFYGLATTVPGIVDTIKSLAPQDGETGASTFNRLLSGLESQLNGMGVAFSSSLLGLAGSLVVGLLELLVSHGQNRFYRELEEWLSSITRLSFAAGDDSGSGEMGAMASVLDHMAEQMESLQQMFTQSDISRSMVDEKLGALVDSVNGMTQKMEQGGGGDNSALDRIANGQEQLIAIMAERGGDGSDGMDAESRMRLRNMDVQLLRILEEISAGRQESITELRTDLQALISAVQGDDRGAAIGQRLRGRVPGQDD